MGWWFEWAQPLALINEDDSLIRCLVYHCLESLLPDALVPLVPCMQLDAPATSDARCAQRRLKSLSFFVTSQVVKGLYLGNIRGKCLPLLHLRIAVGSLGKPAGLEASLSSGATCACSQRGTSASSGDPKLPKSPIPIASDSMQLKPRKGDVWGELWLPAGSTGAPLAWLETSPVFAETIFTAGQRLVFSLEPLVPWGTG